METTTTPSPGTRNGSRKRIWIILFAISAVMNVFQWINKGSIVDDYEMKTDSLNSVRINLEKELGETYGELNQYRGMSERLDSLLTEANGSIDQQKDRIDELLRSERNARSLNKKLNAELEELKKLRNEYLEKLDEMMVENENLKKSNEDLNFRYTDLSKNLESTINQASVIKSEYLNVTAYKRRSGNKFTPTAMAKRTNKMEVCFTVLENKIAKPGEKTVYLRIIEPGGKTLGARVEGSSTFTIPATGEIVNYTNSEGINYDNSKKEMCMGWTEQDRVFTAGTYAVEIYVDGYLSASTSYSLK